LWKTIGSFYIRIEQKIVTICIRFEQKAYNCLVGSIKRSWIGTCRVTNTLFIFRSQSPCGRQRTTWRFSNMLV